MLIKVRAIKRQEKMKNDLARNKALISEYRKVGKKCNKERS